MVVKASQERVSTLLKDTITLLCKNGLEFQNKFSVEALIGVTLDDNEVFLISMNELVKSDNVIEDVEGQAPDTTSGRSTHQSPEHKRKRRHRETEGGSGDTGLDPMVKVKSEPTAHEPPGGGSQDSDRVINPKTEQLWGEEGPPSLSLSAVDDSSSQSYPANPDEPTAKSQRTENLDDDDDDDDDDGDDLVFVKQEGSEMPRSSCAMSQSFPGRSPSSQQFSPGAYSSQPNFGDMSLQSLTSRESSAIWSQTSPGMSSPQSFASPVRGGRQRISTVTSGSLDPSLEQQPGHRIYSEKHRCSFCTKVVSNKASLKRHEDRYHRGIYPYRCEICSKGFTSSTNLKGHMVDHTGIKEFKCPLCDSQFRYKRSLKDHMLIAHQTGMI